MKKCPLCAAADASRKEWSGGWSRYQCPTCWDFFILDTLADRTHALLTRIDNISGQEVELLHEQLGPIADGIHLLSGTARLGEIEERGEPRRFDMETAREAIRSAPQDVVEKADRLLLSLGVLADEEPGRIFEITRDDQSLAFARDRGEYLYIAKMLGDWEFVELVADDQAFWLTAEGWNRIRELRTAGGESIHAFVAMGYDEFRPSLYSEAIAEAIAANGYTPLRLDEDEFPGLIDERMLLQIQRSRFLVAEVSDCNLGAYFEAGYALGIGRSVFFTCHKDCIGDQHFDISHYNHVLWENKEDLREKLDRRIRFWIGSRIPRDD